MRKAGVERSVIMKITGHKTTSMLERYDTVDRDDALEAIKRLDDFLTKPLIVDQGGQITSISLQGHEAVVTQSPQSIDLSGGGNRIRTGE
jgi:hypothetical protein